MYFNTPCLVFSILYEARVTPGSYIHKMDSFWIASDFVCVRVIIRELTLLPIPSMGTYGTLLCALAHTHCTFAHAHALDSGSRWPLKGQQTCSLVIGWQYPPASGEADDASLLKTVPAKLCAPRPSSEELTGRILPAGGLPAKPDCVYWSCGSKPIFCNHCICLISPGTFSFCSYCGGPTSWTKGTNSWSCPHWPKEG